jgi:non-homologous end joining protein Ku
MRKTNFGVTPEWREDKAKGRKRQPPSPKPARSNVIDLVAALQESLAQKKPRKRGAA